MIELERLEAFHDGELPASEAAEVAEFVRTDSSARAALGSIAAVDRLAVEALNGSFGSLRPARPVVPGWRSAAALVAACALIALVAIPGLRTPAGVTAPAPRRGPTPLGQAPLVASGPQLRIIATFGDVHHPGFDRARVETPADTKAFNAALAAGDARDAAERFRSATSDERAALASELASLLKSARTANSVLDGLTAEEQYEICAEWVREPRWRTVAFERLASLRAHPELGVRVAALAQRLSDDAELASWVRSYRLA